MMRTVERGFGKRSRRSTRELTKHLSHFGGGTEPSSTIFRRASSLDKDDAGGDDDDDDGVG